MALLRLSILTLIHAYRLLVSPILPRSCRFEPTCSAYAAEAVRRFGAGTGGWLTLRRLVRCHPWGGAGFDPVPETPSLVRPGLRDACSGRTSSCDAAPGAGSAR